MLSLVSCHHVLVLATLLVPLVGCGSLLDRPPSYQPAVKTGKVDSVTESASDTSGDSMQAGKIPAEKTESKGEASPTPGTTPAPVPSAGIPAPRIAPNAAEKASMSTLYAAAAAQGGCVSCHGELAASAKKGRTAVTIQNAMNILQHRNVAAAGKWPRDVADTSNDGTDQAQLLASALAELLK